MSYKTRHKNGDMRDYQAVATRVVFGIWNRLKKSCSVLASTRTQADGKVREHMMYDGLTSCEMAAPPVASMAATKAELRPVERPARDLRERQKQFSALVVSVKDALFARALRWSRNHTQAEDLVQETYLCAWREFDRFTLGTCFRAWVFQILRFQAMNQRRSASARQQTVDFHADDSLYGRSTQGEAEFEPSETDWESLSPHLVDDTLKDAFDALPPEQRGLALRISLGGRSYRECASELGIPIGTVMSRYWRARESLQRRLRHGAALERSDHPNKRGGRHGSARSAGAGSWHG